MVLARCVEPASKLATIEILNELGVRAPHRNTLTASLKRATARDYRDTLARACRAHSVRTTGTSALILYDVTPLHFENGEEDDLRRVGMSKAHRVDPQVQVVLLAVLEVQSSDVVEDQGRGPGGAYRVRTAGPGQRVAVGAGSGALERRRQGVAVRCANPSSFRMSIVASFEA